MNTKEQELKEKLSKFINDEPIKPAPPVTRDFIFDIYLRLTINFIFNYRIWL